ncbi:hypothetical protein GCM10009804_75090 [Kribbella hippodromi]|uniref:Uncharacterized protein n=1 Tax=Kribbella hippodromi TaxID=434347 RepID=A0ABN2EIG0_9ACTN
MSEGITVWERLNPSAPATTATTTSNGEGDPQADRRRFWRRVHLLDLIAFIAWGYVISKVFLADWDRALVRKAFPNYEWVVNFRILLFIAVALVLLRVGKKGLGLLWIAYVIVWPIALISWRIPRFAYRKGSWNGVVALVHVLIGGIRGFKSALIGAGLAVLTLFFAVLPGRTPAVLSAITAFLVLIWYLYCAARSILAPGRFMRTQSKIVRRINPKTLAVNYKELAPLIEGGDALTPAQSDQFIQAAQSALLLHRSTHFWAYRINEYRKSPALMIYSVIAIVWLFIGCVVAFTFINLAIYQASPSSFVVAGDPLPVKFLYYSTVSMYAGEANIVQAVGGFAIVVKTLEAFLGPVIVVGLIATLILSYKHTRDDEAAQQAVNDIRGGAARFEAEFANIYKVTPDDALMYLQQMGRGMSGIFTFLFQSMPTDFDTGQAKPDPPDSTEVRQSDPAGSSVGSTVDEPGQEVEPSNSTSGPEATAAGAPSAEADESVGSQNGVDSRQP